MAVTETVVPTSDPQALLGTFVDHLTGDHGAEFDAAENGDRVLDQNGFQVQFGVRPKGLMVRLSGPNENALVFLKQEVVQHVSEVDAALAAQIRWQGETIQEGALPSNFHLLTVLKSVKLFPGMQRVTLRFPDIAKVAHEGLHLKLMMPLEMGRKPIWPVMGSNGSPVWPQGDDQLHARFVTIKNVRPDVEEVDVDIVRHADGLISRWAMSASAGSEVGAMGPAGMTELPAANGYFLAADGTGLPAVAQLLARLPQDAQGDVVIALPDDVALESYLPESRFRIHRLSPELFEKRIGTLARDLTKRGETGYAFFAGEFANAQDLRRHFKSGLGLDKTTQISTAFWRRGTPGFGE